jgi:hypothetical protein
MQYLKWKNAVEASLKKLIKYDVQVLTLTPGCIELMNSDETSIDRWEKIDQVSIKSDYLSMTGKDGTAYLFPKKAMEPGEFEILIDYVRKRMCDTGAVKISDPEANSKL